MTGAWVSATAGNIADSKVIMAGRNSIRVKQKFPISR